MNHPDTLYEQTEDYQGPNFAYKDEGEVAPNKTGIATEGGRNVVPVVKEVHLPDMSDEELLRYYRSRYRQVSGIKPDFRWGSKRLKEEIEAWEKQVAEELEAAVKLREGESAEDPEPELVESGE
jgi:hypothetical protein